MRKRRFQGTALIAYVLVSGFVLSSCLGGGDPIVLTREAEASEEYSGWEIRNYYTGISLVQTLEESPTGNYVLLEFNAPAPGHYYPWGLVARTIFGSGEALTLKITATPVKSNSQSKVDSVELTIPDTRAPEWVSAGTAALPKRWLDLPEIGSYYLTVEGLTDGDARIILDKMLLTGQPRFAPTGYGHALDTVEAVLPPAWAFGVIYGGYTDQQGTMARIDSIIAYDLPIDGYWIDSWFWDYSGKGQGPEGYLNFTGDMAAYPRLEVLWQSLAYRRIKAGIWTWNAIQETGNETAFREFLERDLFTGPPYPNTDPWHNAGQASLIGDIDFENPDATVFWKQKMKPLFDQGLDFLKLDRSSEIYFLQAAFEATQELGRETRGRGFILSHLHSTYDPVMKKFPTKWTGDSRIAWTQPDYPDLSNYAMGGLRENVLMVANPRKTTYEIPFLTHDAGGYDFFGSDELSDSLYMRWIQFSMFNPVTTVFTHPRNPTANLPFRFSELALENFRIYSHLKMRLFPYIYSYAHLTREQGRKMIWGDARYPDQYQFGQELLVAPVVERGAGSREVYLPEGQWIDYYDHQVWDGDQVIDYEAPIDRLPLLVRGGSIIPMRPYARSIELGSNDTLELLVFPGNVAEGSFELWEDDGLSNGYERGEVARTVFQYQKKGQTLRLSIDPPQGTYEGFPAERHYFAGIFLDGAPAGIRIDGQELPASAWNYDPQLRWLEIELGRLTTSKPHRIELGIGSPDRSN